MAITNGSGIDASGCAPMEAAIPDLLIIAFQYRLFNIGRLDILLQQRLPVLYDAQGR